MLRLLAKGGIGPLPGLGELVLDRGMSRLGRVEDVGVPTKELLRRREEGSRGVAMVDMVGTRRGAGRRTDRPCKGLTRVLMMYRQMAAQLKSAGKPVEGRGNIYGRGRKLEA